MKKVLIVSEPSVIISSIISLCKDQGDEVVHVQSGAVALSEVFQNKYDILVCSLFLEGIDGVQFINIIKTSQTLNGAIPTIMLTSGEHVEKLFSKDNKPDFILQKNKSILDDFLLAYTKLGRNIFSSKINVLYIDDDKFIQKMVSLWLGKVKNISLDICGSVADVKKMTENKYDIIVSDNILGDGEFSDVIKLVQSSALKDTPVIVYTGSVDKINIDEVKEMGNILDILPKPFKMESFLKKIDSINRLKKGN